MAVTSIIQGQGAKLRTIKVSRSVLVQGQVVNKGQTVRVSEVDALTLVAGGQADFAEDTDTKDAK